MGVKETKFNQSLVPLMTFRDSAGKLKQGFGKTDLISSGDVKFDEYLGGGIGRANNGYEIILIAGPSGMGKSTMALNFVPDALDKGMTVGLMVLEDQAEDVYNRIQMIDPGAVESPNLMFMAEQKDDYTLDDVFVALKLWFEVCDMVILDHVQFLFEGTVTERQENEWNRQRIFMRKVNQLMKDCGKTLVIVSHVNKSGDKNGLDKINGSSSIPQAATKVIMFYRDDSGKSLAHLLKTRFTPYRSAPHQVRANKFKLESYV